MLTITAILLALALATALWLRPWQFLRGGALVSPLLGSLVVLPWLWALPWMHTMPLQMHWSFACLVLLMLGWPLAVPTLCTIALMAGLLGSQPWEIVVMLAFWRGVLPATLALGLGAAIRRVIGPHLFVYVLGRGFLGAAACLFAASALLQWSGPTQPGLNKELSLVAHWLTAWGDAFVTGMLTAIFVAFKPEWLATWSDTLYLHKT
ncbi:MAG: hypothetical protein KGQ30_00735 [Burkholderiales bacterium]|jgi:uncharacterized membrane protein|uniref:Uncharacterized protein n=1 Tax=Simplicispira hankyongi TaxID=2315688 RepID=A0A398CED0_9BURK|nr:hypothetical protein [Simplicispira hankyongi]MBU6465219.1 hypothetical protein [Burkholderiales bacterium]RID99368.1 hypothetical protein D3F03_02775 [Simplicispira hankyongi]